MTSSEEVNSSELQPQPKRSTRFRRERFGRAEIADGICHLEGLPTTTANRVVQIVIDQIILAIVNGYQVYLPKLGRLEGVYVKQRYGVHPQTLEQMVISPSVRARFSQSSTLKGLLEKELGNFQAFYEAAPSDQTDQSEQIDQPSEED